MKEITESGYLRIHIIPMIHVPSNLVEIDDLIIELKRLCADRVFILYVNTLPNQESIESISKYIKKSNILLSNVIIDFTPIENTIESLTQNIIIILTRYSKPQCYLNVEYWNEQLIVVSTILIQYIAFQIYHTHPTNEPFIPILPTHPFLDRFTILLLHQITTYYQEEKKVLIKSDYKGVLKQNPEFDTYSKSAFNNWFLKSWFELKKSHYIVEKDAYTPIELTKEGMFADSLYNTLYDCRVNKNER